MREMTDNLLVVLESFLPAYATLNSDAGDAAHVGLVQTQFAGRAIDFDRTWKSMVAMDADDDENARKEFRQYLMLVLDGSGTVIHEPNQSLTRMQHFCYWKDQYQLRWYIVVDMHGHIVFTSAVYVGKLDDSAALLQTGFYE
jgi:hypothetical protein